MPASSLITLALGGTSIQLNGPDGGTDIACLNNWVTDQSQGLQRWAYRGTDRYCEQWTIACSSLTAAQSVLLRNFFYRTALGPTHTFNYTHTDGVAYTARFVDTGLQLRRTNSNEWACTFKLELLGQQVNGSATTTTSAVTTIGTTTTTQTTSTTSSTTSTTTTMAATTTTTTTTTEAPQTTTTSTTTTSDNPPDPRYTTTTSSTTTWWPPNTTQPWTTTSATTTPAATTTTTTTAAPAQGRCCYPDYPGGYPARCVVTNQSACNNLDGTWTSGGICNEDPLVNPCMPTTTSTTGCTGVCHYIGRVGSTPTGFRWENYSNTCSAQCGACKTPDEVYASYGYPTAYNDTLEVPCSR